MNGGLRLWLPPKGYGVPIKRSQELSGYGWKTWHIDGTEAIRLVFYGMGGQLEITVDNKRTDGQGRRRVVIEICGPDPVQSERYIMDRHRQGVIVTMPGLPAIGAK